MATVMSRSGRRAVVLTIASTCALLLSPAVAQNASYPQLLAKVWNGYDARARSSDSPDKKTLVAITVTLNNILHVVSHRCVHPVQ